MCVCIIALHMRHAKCTFYATFGIICSLLCYYHILQQSLILGTF